MSETLSPKLPGPTAHALVLREAKRLHRCAVSDALAVSLPLLRRLQAAGLFTALSLPQLHRQRALVQRKHLLRLLAVEAGHADWLSFRQWLAHVPAADVALIQAGRLNGSQLNLWFASHGEAEAYVHQHGGEVIRVRHQAVVVP